MKQMKERQLTGLKRGDKVPFRPNVSNEEPTTQCKELAKIAGTCGCSPHVVSFGRYPKILG